MAPSKRHLPEKQNPLILPEHTPQLEILIERRRLGQTNLAVKPGQVGLGNASKTENLGIFDYAHLRVPLPKDLKGSGIFSLSEKTAYPESYFLMRRSSDGYISATGMFKAAFPWASLEEEESERQHHKSVPTGDGEEVAGNVWTAPEQALILAEEYGMKPWIVALLDPEPIEKGTKDKEKAQIATPPRFIVPDKGSLLPPSGTASMRTRSRELRSASPSKIATPSRKMASPRKSRTTRRSAKTEETTSALRNALENGVKPASEPTESVATGSVAPSVDGETVRVEVDEVVEKNGDVETTTTTVKVDMPADHPELPLPEDTEAMVAQAKAMVEKAKEEEAAAVGAQINGVKSLKRKAEEVEPEEAAEQAAQPAKKTKVLEQELKKERIKTKSLIGVTAVLAAGAALNWFL